MMKTSIIHKKTYEKRKMNENVKLYKYKDRVLVIDRTGDVLTQALISCELDMEGIATSLYTINSLYESGNHYFNPFRYHQGHEHLANLLFPIKKGSDSKPGPMVTKKRKACSDFLKSHQAVNQDPLGIDGLLEVIGSTEMLQDLSDKALSSGVISEPLMLLTNKAILTSVFKVLKTIQAEPLMSKEVDFEYGQGFMCSGKKEIDLKEMNHMGYMIYIYTPKQRVNCHLSEALVINSFKSAVMLSEKPIPPTIKTKLLKVYERLNSSVIHIN